MPTALSPFRYPGGKTRLLPTLEPHLRALLEGKDTYREPFVGGGSVLLWVARNFPKLKLVANDLNPGVAAFWRVMKTSKKVESLCARLDVQPTVPLF